SALASSVGGAANQGKGTGTRGGVTSLSRTTSHSPWATAGRRTSRPTATATSASRVAMAALLNPISSRRSIFEPLRPALRRGLFVRVRVAHQFQEVAQLGRGQALHPHQVGQQWLQRPAAHFLDQDGELSADQVIPTRDRLEVIHTLAALAADAALGLQA